MNSSALNCSPFFLSQDRRTHLWELINDTDGQILYASGMSWDVADRVCRQANAILLAIDGRARPAEIAELAVRVIPEGEGISSVPPSRAHEACELLSRSDAMSGRAAQLSADGPDTWDDERGAYVGAVDAAKRALAE